MAGKPNFPDDVDHRDDLKESASGTPGLTRLDEEREASLADEGGASGGVVDSQDLPERESPGLKPSNATIKVAIAIAVAGAAGLMAYRRWS